MLVAGFDEVGRGAWAGPLLVAGVVLDVEDFLNLKDSKQLTKSKRKQTTSLLLRSVVDIKLIWKSAQFIDTVTLGSALREGFVDAANSLVADLYIIDGNVDYLHMPNSESVIRGDENVPAIAAASIIAKYYRDTFMIEYSRVYKNYGFEQHVGYGTKQHMEALKKYGVCALHRKSFKPVAPYV